MSTPKADNSGMIDIERAGGTGNAAPKRVALTTEPMSLDEALAYAHDIAWRTFLPRGDRAVQTLVAEVKRLNAVIAADADLERRESAAWREAYRVATVDLARLCGVAPIIDMRDDYPGKDDRA